MNRIILMLLLTIVSSSAMAEWVRLDGDATGAAYSDPSRLLINGNMVKMWSLLDFKSPQKIIGSGTYLSIMTQEEYDCKEEKVRNIYSSYHSENMGKGYAILPSSDVAGKWNPVEPHSSTESMWKLACGKK